jgi:hypothetical protein
MTPKQLISSAARRAATAVLGADVVIGDTEAIEREFDWVEGLIGAVELHFLNGCGCSVGKIGHERPCEKLRTALAAIPRGENE